MITSKSPLKPGLFALAAALLISGPLAAQERPNIIYILADDLGYGDLGCYGQKTLTTPNLDRMAAEGMRFTRHYAGSTVCAPSRCVLMTGFHTGHATVRGNNEVLLKPEDVTVAEVLKEAGYRTGCFGKWGVGHPPPRTDPNDQGFDAFYGYVNMFHAHNFYPEFLIRDGEVEPLRNETKAFWEGQPGFELGGPREGAGVASKKVDYAPDLITDEAIRFIRDSRDEPFFLYFAMNVPHTNNEGGRDKEQQDGMEVPTYGEFAAEDWPNPEKGFAAMIRNIDRDVGRVLDTLAELDLDEQTIVFFSSDNGPHQEGGHQMEFFDSNGPLRGKKRDLWEGGVRVPFIVRWPGKIAAGTESDHLSGFQDFLATAADLAGIVSAVPTDGISFMPTLQGRGQEQPKHAFLYWEFFEQGGKVAVVTERWKALRLNTLKTPAEPIRLYDLENDLSEENDVANQYPEKISEFSKAMIESHVDPE